MDKNFNTADVYLSLNREGIYYVDDYVHSSIIILHCCVIIVLMTTFITVELLYNYCVDDYIHRSAII